MDGDYAMGWITEKSCSISGRNQRFLGLPSLLFSGYQGFSSRVGTADHFHLSIADVKNKLYLRSSMCLHGMYRGNITLLFKDSMIQRLMWLYLSACTKFSVKIWVWYWNRWLHLGLFSEERISIHGQLCNMNFVIYQYLPVHLNNIPLLTSLFSGVTWETYIQKPCYTFPFPSSRP